MTNQDKGESRESRVSIIKNLRTVLGFFGLALLVVEAIFAYVLSLVGAGSDRTIVIVGMIVIIVLILVIVALLAFFRHGSLVNESGNSGVLASGVLPNKKTNIEGTYHAGIDHKYKVMIKRLTGDYYRVFNPDDWEGVGFFDGQCYYGVFKLNDKATPPGRRGNWGAHRSKLPFGKESPFEVFGVEMNENNENYDCFHELEGWNKDA